MNLISNIAIIAITASFFGAVIWIAIYSRMSNSKKLPLDETET